MAKLYFRYAVMNSGKSSDLLQTQHNYKERSMNTILLTPSIDTRTPGRITSRIGLSSEAEVISSVEDIIVIFDKVEKQNVKAVFVDEAQFLSREMVDALARIVDEKDVPVFCYGIKTDFRSELFEGSKRLLEIAESIKELKSICQCGNKALFNARLGDSKEQIVVGAEDQYVTVCRKCYNRRNNENSV